jgi:hypothetical protein
MVLYKYEPTQFGGSNVRSWSESMESSRSRFRRYLCAHPPHHRTLYDLRRGCAEGRHPHGIHLRRCAGCHLLRDRRNPWWWRRLREEHCRTRLLPRCSGRSSTRHLSVRADHVGLHVHSLDASSHAESMRPGSWAVFIC